MRAEVTDDTVRIVDGGPIIQQRCKLCGTALVVTRNSDEGSLAIVHREPTCNSWRNATYLMRRCFGIHELDELVTLIDPTPLTAGTDPDDG